MLNDSEKEREDAFNQLRDTTLGIQEAILAKISTLSELVQDTAAAGAIAAVEQKHQQADGRITDLQQEVLSLQQRVSEQMNEASNGSQLESSAEEVAGLRSHSAALAAGNEAEKQALQNRLNAVTQGREAMETKTDGLERRLEKVTRLLMEAKAIAIERQPSARMSEVSTIMTLCNFTEVLCQVRLQSLSQEAVYWRQFALEADRRRYNTYAAANSFHRSPPDADLQMPAGERRPSEGPRTPTLRGARKAAQLGVSISAGLEVGDRTEGQWWGTAV